MRVNSHEIVIQNLDFCERWSSEKFTDTVFFANTSHQINVDPISHIFHRLIKDEIIHEFVQVFLNCLIVGYCKQCSHVSLHLGFGQDNAVAQSTQ